MLPNALFGTVHMYGIMIAVGVLACFGVLYYCCKRKKIDPNFTDFIFYNGVVTIFLGFIMSMLFQSFYNYLKNPEGGFHFGLNTGMTFLGGLIGGAATFLTIYFLFRKKYTTRLIDILSILPCCILIAHAFGRVGCFFAGCCYGKETDSFLGVKFPDLPNKVYPTQLFEAVFLFLLFFICLYLVMKKNFQHNLSVYLIAYGIFRFFLEFIRGDERGQFIGNISPSQFWSILMIPIGILVYFLFTSKNALLIKRNKDTQNS